MAAWTTLLLAAAHGVPQHSGSAALPLLQWSQVGDTMSRERVTAISMDFGPDGFPVFACGWNSLDVGTRIPVMAWNGQSWVEVYHRTSQFPQSYREFDFKIRNNAYYLGLKVHNQFGSVLNGAVEWRGSYAFHNQLFDYEIDERGDMTMFWISQRDSGGGYPGTNNELVIITYNASGWDGYPAGEEAFGEPVVIDRQNPRPENVTVDEISDIHIKSVTTPAGVSSFILAWVNDGQISVASGTIAEGFTRISLPDTMADTVSLATHGEHACIAYHPLPEILPTATASTEHGDVTVACADNYGRGTWSRLPGNALTDADVVERLAVELTITEEGKVFVAGRKADAPNTLAVRYASLAPSASDAEEEEWAAVDLSADATMTHFEVQSHGNTVFAAVSEGDGEGLRVFGLLPLRD